MRALKRRGFTLVEALVALVLLGIVTAALYRLLSAGQRTAHAQIQRIGLQETLRAAATILPAELRELDAAGGDITAMAATSLSVRAMRQLMFICQPPRLGGGLSNLTLSVRTEPLFGPQLDPGRDSLFIYYEGDEGTHRDDGWIVADLVASAATTCPPSAGGGPALALTVSAVGFPDETRVNRAGAVPTGSPVRAFRALTYRLYRSGDGLWYLGLEGPTETIQPFLGPLAGPNGITFSYFDASGAGTADPTRVALIEIRLRARTPLAVQWAHGGVHLPVDSITTRVALRGSEW